MDAVHSGHVAGEADLERAGERWPAFAPAAIAAGIRATFSFPVTVGGFTLGALDCYQTRTGALTPAQISLGELFADIAADLIVHAQAEAGVDAVVEQLTHDDGPSEVLDRACGITAVHLGLPVERSLQLLRAHAHHNQLSLDEVASRIIDGSLRIKS
jgi:hypothetical protein